jgi:glycosyltransferase involved in cell wall biosynthesis
MRIAIIAHPCRAGGSLAITLNFIKALKDVAADDQFLVVCSASYGYEDIELPKGSELFVYKGSQQPFPRYCFENFKLPKIVSNYKPDLVFGIGNIGLTRLAVPQVLFIGQAYLFYNKKHYPGIPLRGWLRIAALKRQLKKSLPATRLILCQTPIVRQRLSEKFNYPREWVKVVTFPPPAEVMSLNQGDKPETFSCSDTFYVLLLTRYLTHRNPSILIPLCKRFGNQIKNKRIKFITTVERGDHPKARKFLSNIVAGNFQDIIINVGKLSRNDVSRYLSHSHLLWLPTLLETLCLPYLEAMKCGTAIMAPDIDFAKYVCGDAAIFYNPWDIDSIFNTLMSIRENDSLRHALIEKGMESLNDRQKFSGNWRETATNIMHALRVLATRS